ncbi:queuine tRNA-ribosyltransferase, putative [Ichthyophthirius multifiliis]|uniref:Queuine tRNA-ribosyltransferase catalytic subunit 1 n=1 Tax=Ichthyophthirius multifiliis TaxID=5932 RepID=G0R0J6_ICHMU|nr:queuine tRNA-ribosyltransferase, putative [Ichthyophthirius multifiliis]EGR29008.1 queuine tRNA-ribosyltransferase, putative [Ichthyophthirius multifiliis]|eukprot:XP_004030244.1 queuine tRNA-ribosyltransferase, putative [Ichthyophthirius multifiliis]
MYEKKKYSFQFYYFIQQFNIVFIFKQTLKIYCTQNHKQSQGFNFNTSSWRSIYACIYASRHQRNNKRFFFQKKKDKNLKKGLTSEEMENLNCRLLLGNTYHLAYQPGGDFLEKVGGLHKYMNWKYNILTDSGGFQMVSLSKLCEITEEGVRFSSPVDGSEMFLRPEDSVHTQNQIGADIMMALDDVVQTTTQGERMKIACERTVRWIDRNIEAHKKQNEQNLYPIVQGGIDFELRKYCLEQLISKDAAGYAIGGLAGGEDKQDFWRIVNLCTDYLPKDKPVYLMGVGYPEDLVVCACLGVDQFDCVFSTRTARFGTAFTKYGFLKLKNSERQLDLGPIDDDCGCETCKRFSVSFLYNTIGKEETACHLVSYHNLYYLLNLMKNLRQSILDGTLQQFVNNFFKNYYKYEKKIPQWIKDAMEAAKINLTFTFDE